MMNRRKALVVVACVVAVIGSAGALTWTFWPPPPPTTADQVYSAVMDSSDPATMSDEELDRWITVVAATVERLPPHEFQALVQRAMQDEKLQERFRSLSPEQRDKLVNLISERQQQEMMKVGIQVMKAHVAALKLMPKSLRDRQLQAMHERMQRHRSQGPRRQMSKERFAEWHAATTPRERAEFVRTMREMRRMMEQAGISD